MDIKKPIRILHVLTAMNRAGTETLLMSFYRAIDRSKVQFDFAVSSTDCGDYDDEIQLLGGKIIHYPRYTGKNHFGYKKWWNNFFEDHPEYKIIHGHIGSTASIYLGIAKQHGCYIIAHSHSTNARISIHSILYKVYSYSTRFVADYFFGCSYRALCDRYGKRIANDRSKSQILNNAIDANKFNFNEDIRRRIRSEYGVHDEIVIGTVGRLTPQKNPYEIIRICEELKRRNVDFLFWWFGEGELKAGIKESISKRGLNDCIHLLGTRSDINRVLQGMDIFIFPSVWEGLGISCIESQAAGLPTLCSDIVPEEAQVTELCHYLPLNNTNQWCDEIVKTIQKIKGSNYKRCNMYEQIVKSGYDIAEQAKMLENFYVSLKNSCDDSSKEKT